MKIWSWRNAWKNFRLKSRQKIFFRWPKFSKISIFSKISKSLNIFQNIIFSKYDFFFQNLEISKNMKFFFLREHELFEHFFVVVDFLFLLILFFFTEEMYNFWKSRFSRFFLLFLFTFFFPDGIWKFWKSRFSRFFSYNCIYFFFFFFMREHEIVDFFFMREHTIFENL